MNKFYITSNHSKPRVFAILKDQPTLMPQKQEGPFTESDITDKRIFENLKEAGEITVKEVDEVIALHGYNAEKEAVEEQQTPTQNDEDYGGDDDVEDAKDEQVENEVITNDVFLPKKAVKKAVKKTTKKAVKKAAKKTVNDSENSEEE